ncbi:uncharacterized protein LOC106636143 [Copidosoma floridanum]|uniref:uncharacterized protein LOC106636143 n=1 Tax=Copidosoma floridanum TaxID=29053 RepID=UPI000C6FB46D|nr:uncharacterized protein LOC106636143 [Copidosoma floridanum]
MTKKNEILSETINEAIMESTNPTDQDIIEYSPDTATVIQRTIKDKDGIIIKETTETTTLRVTHNTHFGVASYKLVSNTITDHTEHLDHRELQDLNRTIVDDCYAIPPPPPLPPALTTHREEHTYASPSKLISYTKSEAHGSLNGHTDRKIGSTTDQAVNHGSKIPVDYQTPEISRQEREFLEKMKTVSSQDSSVVPAIQQQCQQLAVAACATAFVAVEELTVIPAATIAVCELN